jgi:hypothetical protein
MTWRALVQVALLVGPRVAVLVVKDHGLKRTWVLVIDAR